MSNFKIFFLFLFAAFASQAAEIGIPIQLKLKSPGGTYPTESGVNFTVSVLSPSSGCILREESFSSQNVVDGAVSLALGTGSLTGNDPGLSLVQVYDNTTAKTGLRCVDANNNVISTGQSYSPSAGDKRLIRVSTVLLSDSIIVNFNMRSVPYAVQADAVGGIGASEILVRNTSSQLNQTNLNNLLLDATRLSNLLAIASSGSATSAGSFTGSLAGDVSGGQGSTSVDKIKGVPVSAAAPTAGQVLQFNGTQYVPANMASSTVTSVAGRTGAVTLSNSDISGLGSAAVLNAGSSAGELVQLDGSGKIPAAYLPGVSGTPIFGDVSGTTSVSVVAFVGGKSRTEIAAAVDDVQAATSTNSADTLVKRDSSGNFSSNIISSSSNSTSNLYLFDSVNSIRLKAPSGLSSNLVLTLPSGNGSNGQILQTDGAGNLSWASVSSAGGSVTGVTASSPLSSSGGTAPNISIAVGTASGTVAAGDDSRITGALQASDYYADVSGAASCSNTQAPYWDSVSNNWGCVNISFPADAVTSVAGRTGAVALTSSDISGLGTAAVLNAGTSANNLVQLDAGSKIPVSTLPASVTASVNDTVSATSVNTAGTLVKRDGSGNFSAGVISASTVSASTVTTFTVNTNAVYASTVSATVVSSSNAETDNVALRSGANKINLKAPAGLGSDLTLNLPSNSGSAGQVLLTDGAGNLSWANVSSAGGVINSVTASAPLSSSGGANPNISLTQASGSVAGYLSSSDWTAFNNKQAALGYTPVNVTDYNADVAPAASCTSSQTAYWNTVSDTWACQSITYPVTTVAGRTGAVTLTSSDISGLGTAAVLNAGTSANNLVQLDAGSKIPSSTLPSSVVLTSTALAGDVSGTTGATSVVSVGGKSSTAVATAVNDTVSATSVNTASTIVKRDASGNFSAGVISASTVSASTVTTVTVNTNAVNASSVSATAVSSSNATTDNLFLRSGSNTINLKAPAGLGSNLTLNLPSNNGSAGQVLLTDGAGNLSWANVSAAGGSVNSVTASAPLSSSGGANPNISLTQASGSAAGYLSSADWTTFNNKQAALGFTPVNATDYNSDVAPAASCTSSQTAYWNTVSDTWACQSITFPVTSVAGRTGAVTLTSSDISGLGTAAVLNAGASASNVVQLDGTARIPASTLPTNAVTTSTALSGDVTGTVTTVSVDKIKGYPVSATAPTAGQALVYNGSAWVPTTGFPSFAKLTADVAYTGNTYTNVTGLSFAVASGSVYKYKFHILYTSASTNTGLGLGLTYPSATSASALVNIASAGDGVSSYYQGIINASGDTVQSGNTPATTSIQFATIEGVIVPSAAGTVQLTAASEVPGSSVTIKAGSLVEVTVVP